MPSSSSREQYDDELWDNFRRLLMKSMVEPQVDNYIQMVLKETMGHGADYTLFEPVSGFLAKELDYQLRSGNI